MPINKNLQKGSKSGSKKPRNTLVKITRLDMEDFRNWFGTHNVLLYTIIFALLFALIALGIFMGIYIYRKEHFEDNDEINEYNL
jgi:hypothetical protein